MRDSISWRSTGPRPGSPWVPHQRFDEARPKNEGNADGQPISPCLSLQCELPNAAREERLWSASCEVRIESNRDQAGRLGGAGDGVTQWRDRPVSRSFITLMTDESSVLAWADSA